MTAVTATSAAPQAPAGTGQAYGPDYNKALARRWFEEGWSKGNLDVADEIFAPDFTLRGRVVGPEGPRRSVLARRTAFADLTVEVVLQVADEDTVATHFVARGRHVGEYSAVEPTGEPIVAAGVQIWRLRDGRAVEDWNIFDRWELVAQIDPEIRARSLFRAAPEPGR